MRFFALPVLAWVAGVMLTGRAEMAHGAPAGKQRVYIGTYSTEPSKGIYRCDLDLTNGTLSEPELAVEAVNPSFLALHPKKPLLYAVVETSMFDGQPTGGVAAYAIDAETGNLQLLNQQSSGGPGPCHLVVDREGNFVLVANYGGGSAAVLPIDPDGKLGEKTGFVQHESVTVDGKKKDPRGHSINLSPVGRFAYVADAGVDKVFIYRYDAKRGTLEPNDPAVGVVPPDAAPRHFTFHPGGRLAYVINERELSVTAFKYNAGTGALTPIQTISTVPDGTEKKGLSTAEVVAHPSGKFLYGSNRGFNSIAGFKIAKDGQLTAIGQFAKDVVKIPRNFNIDLTGTYMLVEGQESNNIVVFKIDQETGELTPTGSSITVGHPVCVKFMK